MALRARILPLVLLAGCGGIVGVGVGTSSPSPQPVVSCSTGADCAGANACVSAACTAGRCAWSYEATVADAILSGSPTGALVQLPIPAFSASGAGYAVSACPTGANPSVTPPVCLLEADFTAATLTFAQKTGGTYEIAGTVPIRVQDVPVSGSVLATSFAGELAVTGNGACPGTAQPFAPLAITVTFAEEQAHWTAPVVTATLDPTALGAAVTPCGDATFLSVASQIAPLVSTGLASAAAAQLAARAELQVCLTAPCPGYLVDDGGICRVRAGGACAVRGLDPVDGMVVIPACGP